MLSDLKFFEKEAFEELFTMGGGYVLDFSDRTFSSFFSDYGINIDDEKYHIHGTSKAKRLRAFWETEPNDTVGRVLADLVKVAARSADSQNLVNECGAIANRLIENKTAADIPKEESFLSKSFEIDISKLNLNSELERVIQQRLDEIDGCMKSGSSLSVVFLCGSTLEGLLLNQASMNPAEFNKAKASPKGKDGSAKPFSEWVLNDFINASYECRYIQKDVRDFSHVMRNFRNYIHPHQQMVESFYPDEHTAEIARQVLKTAIADLSGERNS